MGNSWGNCPSNIKHQVKQCGVSYCFSPLVSMVTAALRDFPQETNQRKKEGIEREKGQRRVKKRLEGCIGVQYFLLRGQSPVSFSTNRVLIHRSQGVKHKLVHCLCHCFCSFSIFFLLYCELAKGDSCVQWHRCKHKGVFSGLSVAIFQSLWQTKAKNFT